jgi:hypothetical protein
MFFANPSPGTADKKLNLIMQGSKKGKMAKASFSNLGSIA